MPLLHNRVNKDILRQRLMEEPFKRTTISFYRYTPIEDPAAFRDEMYKEWSELDIFGRVYVAHEGYNAQMCVPEHNYDTFVQKLYPRPEFAQVPIKIAVEDDGKSFYKLIVKVRQKIVADGLNDNAFDTSNVGRHLTAEEFNAAMENPDTLVIDMRNHYEAEVGHFENALLPDGATFRDVLPEMLQKLEDKKDKKLLLYCTGGIRCEKASAFLRHHGFEDVNQLHGGIIEYARQVRGKGLPSKYKGKNFVFDERLGEKITEDVISVCHQCGSACDTHVNCANDACHLLFIQCEQCRNEYDGCCSAECQDFYHLPEDVKEAKKREEAQKRSVYESKKKENLKNKFKFYRA